MGAARKKWTMGMARTPNGRTPPRVHFSNAPSISGGEILGRPATATLGTIATQGIVHGPKSPTCPATSTQPPELKLGRGGGSRKEFPGMEISRGGGDLIEVRVGLVSRDRTHVF